MPWISKNEYWKNTPYRNANSKTVNNAVLKKLNGLETWYKWINPVVPVIKTAKELTKASSRWKAVLNKTIITTSRKTVTPAGILFLNIFKIKFPDTILVLGSKANINDGIPIVQLVIKVSWIGMKKYSDIVNKQVRINKIV